MNNDDARYIKVMLEQVIGQNKAVLEAVADLPTRTEFNELKEGVDELRQDVKIIKAVVTDHSRQMTDHERRITRLEAA